MANATTMTHPGMRSLFWIAIILALTVLVLGAYTRLTDAGLGCPDWPGCYGQLIVPNTPHAIQQADNLYPSQPVEAAKAWSEMIHRYAAGTLGLLIFIYTIFAVIRRARAATLEAKQQPIALPLALTMLVIFQAILGKWTVTMRLLPIVVMGHLLGGFTILALLWLLKLQVSPYAWLREGNERRIYRFWAIVGLIILILQIALGGWTSANYAALACPDFPYCNGQLFPVHELRMAFHVSLGHGVDFQGGVLDSATRMTIQVIHRLGALITSLYLLWLGCWMIFTAQSRALRVIATTVLIILFIQLCLGIMNVVLLLPLPIAVMHNAMAALLLLSLVTLNYTLYAKPAAP